MIAYESLVLEKYIAFFADKDSVYMHEDEDHPPRYIGVAFEFLSKISSSELLVDYSDLYGKVFKDEKWLYVDSLESLTDDFVASLTAVQVVTILAAIRHNDLFCTGFFRLCGQTGTITRLLKQLKYVLERTEKT